MKGAKLRLELANGTKVWLNVAQAVKMQRMPDGRYYLYMVNGEIFEIDRSMAREVENSFEDD